MRLSKRKTFALVLLVCFCGILKFFVEEQSSKRRNKDDDRFLPSVSTAKFLSIGFEPAIADLYWIEAINYFGAQLVKKSRTYQFLPQYCDLILNLDPLFSIFYEWAGTAFIYNGLPIDNEAIIRSTEYANRGIREFDKQHRYDWRTIQKAAFNYVLEANNYLAGIPYFTLAARIFRDQRDMLLVASTYASVANQIDLSTDLKMEFLSYVAFEAQRKEELLYAIRVLSSANFNQQSARMIKSLRVKMEKDDDVRKLVENRMKEQTIYNREGEFNSPLTANPKLDNILAVDFSRTWLPPELHVLLSL